jgi:hypothetical protein
MCGAGGSVDDIGAVSGQAGFGGDHDVVWVGVEGIVDYLFGDVWSVGVGGVEKLHPKVNCSPDDRNAFVAVLRFSPDAPAGQPHGPEPQPGD